jgi:hypothetical protein
LPRELGTFCFELCSEVSELFGSQRRLSHLAVLSGGTSMLVPQQQSYNVWNFASYFTQASCRFC